MREKDEEPRRISIKLVEIITIIILIIGMVFGYSIASHLGVSEIFIMNTTTKEYTHTTTAILQKSITIPHTITLTAHPIVTTQTITEYQRYIKKTISDLRYIRILATSYNDDPDPHDDGIAIDILFYDSRQELIVFENTSILVYIELFGYRDIQETFDHQKMQLVFQTAITMDHSMSPQEMLGNYIRIPYQQILIDVNQYHGYGTIKVTVVETDNRFTTTTDHVKLY